jgi:hypothetical protein
MDHLTPTRSWRTMLVAGLLIVHSVWILNHLRLVAGDKINPWKLGGYGMYTVPDPRQRLAILVETEGGFREIDQRTLNMEGFREHMPFADQSRSFRCIAPPEAAIASLIRDNYPLKHTAMAIVYIERAFDKAKRNVVNDTRGQMIITWEDLAELTYSNTLCGIETSGRIRIE